MRAALKITVELNELNPLTSERAVLNISIPIGEDKLKDQAALRVAIQSVLVQLYIGGIPVQEGSRVRLIPPTRIHEIFCDIPSILLADMSQMPIVLP
jgi:hypothetical protein